MLKKISLVLLLILFSANAYSAGSDSTPKKVKSDYDKAVESIKFAKKYEKKVKLKKLRKDMKRLKNFFLNQIKKNQIKLIH